MDRGQAKAYFIAAVAARTELVMRSSIAIEMAKGFSLYMVRAIMSGRGNQHGTGDGL